MPVARAARLCGVSVPTFCKLAPRTQGPAIWTPGERVQPAVVQHVRQRLQSGWQLSIDQAAAILERPRWYVERAIELGHLILLRATNDSRRRMVGRKAVLALKRRNLTLTPATKDRGRPVHWLQMTVACQFAGVSASTLQRWVALGWMERAKGKRGIPRGDWAYNRTSVMHAARRHWATTRFRRRTPPDWIQQREIAL
jgi:hypothetical protein